ncbi:hypothetical protein QVD17_20985 [Tagetes erecta]|uniref:Uncharacterized protein n=1 Tax=Tagetes erecta TaxID=13708 RepID=A0AAD8KM73_TARER|nr:hypothetical protein QVD17_20985 [Tagetes erecta]
MATSIIPSLEMESVDAPVAPSDSFVFALYMVIVRTILNVGDVKVSSAVIHGVNPSFTSANTSVSFSAAFAGLSISFNIFIFTIRHIFKRDKDGISTSPNSPSRGSVVAFREEFEEEDAWLLLSLDFQWHVRHRKVELGTGEHRHTQLQCNIPVYRSGNGGEEERDEVGEELLVDEVGFSAGGETRWRCGERAQFGGEENVCSLRTTSAEERVDQTSIVCKKKTVCFFNVCSLLK